MIAVVIVALVSLALFLFFGGWWARRPDKSVGGVVPKSQPAPRYNSEWARRQYDHLDMHGQPRVGKSGIVVDNVEEFDRWDADYIRKQVRK